MPEFKIPDTMRAVMAADGTGGVTVQEIPVPRPGPGEVLLRMAAAPVNPSDLSVIDNTSGRTRDYPIQAGREGSGTVVAAGPGLLPRYYFGKRVAASTYGGAWAEYLCVRAIQCAPLPDHVDFEHGAMAIINPVTVLAMLEMARQGGYRAIVNTAAAGQLGRMLAKRALKTGLPVVHIVRREPQAELLRQIGAPHILLSSDPDFEDRLTEITVRLDARLMFDAVGGGMTAALVRAAPENSRIVIYGWLSKEATPLVPGRLISDRVSVEGFFLGTWFRQTSPLRTLPIIRRALRELGGDLESTIAARYDLADAARAVAESRSGTTRGKSLLVMHTGDTHS